MSKYSKLWGKILIVLLVLLCSQALYAAAEKVLYLPADGGLDNLDPRVLTSTSHQLIQICDVQKVRTHAGDVPGMAESLGNLRGWNDLHLPFARQQWSDASR